MFKYGILYGKDIEKMTKEELKQHLVNSRNEINALHDELSDLYIKHGHLFLARSKPSIMKIGIIIIIIWLLAMSAIISEYRTLQNNKVLNESR